MRVAGMLLAVAIAGFVLPAWAGPPGPCDGVPDTDGDGVCDLLDNCREIANPAQVDGDSDGYGNICDCDYRAAAAGGCDGGDFGLFVGQFGKTVPPAHLEFDMVVNGAVDGGDFGAFVAQFGKFPGPACLHPRGTPCP